MDLKCCGIDNAPHIDLLNDKNYKQMAMCNTPATHIVNGTAFCERHALPVARRLAMTT